MANRYWVGGAASWDGTAGTKWATTSGGAGGSAIPTSADDVFFDANSGANTVSIATGNTGAKSINCTGFTGTLGGSGSITVSGSVTLVSGMTFTYAGIMTINATGTFTSAGKSFTGGTIAVNGSGITVTLGDAFSTNINFLATQGTLNTNGYNLTCANLNSSNSNTRTLALSNSTLTLSGTTPINCATSTGLTVTGSATLKCTSSSAKDADMGGISWASCVLDQAGSGALTVIGSNTLYDVTNSYSATGATTIKFTSGTTTTLTQFTATGALGKVLTLGASTTSQATLTKGSTWYMGANSTDGGNNTGLTFTAGGGIDYLSVSYINGTVTAAASNGKFLMFF